MVHDFIPKQRISFALHARTAIDALAGVASHGLACSASCLIPSLALKKLACSKESFSSRGAVKDRANSWWGCSEKRNELKQPVVLILITVPFNLLLAVFSSFCFVSAGEDGRRVNDGVAMPRFV